MIRKTVLLTGIAGLMLTAAPAFAQDAMNPPSASPAPTESAAPTQSSAPAQPGTLQLQPGSDVKGSDGAVLGKLEGVQNNAAGEQELTVRGAEGKLRGVPLGGLKQEGAGVAVAWSLTEYTAAPEIAEPAKPEAAPASEAAPEPATPPAT
ncbi:hypothetical protein BH10PSE1_BH10PSE1_29760 [soil metagenome]